MQLRDEVRADFDAVARLTDEPDRLDGHAGHLLASIPAGCRRALDVGCGTGAFTRRLASRSAYTMAVDLSPEMIRVARELSPEAGIDYRVCDVTTWERPAAGFDVIFALAVLHHLPFEATLRELAGLLVPGGVLVVHDLFASRGLVDVLAGAVALVARVSRGRVRRSPALRRAWAEHGHHDVLLPLTEVRRRAALVLPDARVTRHLDWRYTLRWQRVA
jgi:2-polyprenyl-3-methyl-5-hydroxy-6-metoxy-1,4-benzoquinol methylase